MSSTNRNPQAVRPLLDTYHTDSTLAAYVVEHFIKPRLLAYQKKSQHMILEPHCGQGAWVKAARAAFAGHITALDLVSRYGRNAKRLGADQAFVGDFLTMRADSQWDLILGNPPYGRPKRTAEGNIVYSAKTGKPIFEAIAHEHVAHAVDLLSPHGACFFLLNPVILTGFERKSTWNRIGPPRVLGILSPRPSFTGGQTDSVTYVIAGWGPGIKDRKPIETIYWREKK